MKKLNILNKVYFELTGCIHNHSKYSYDSTVPIKKIIRAAAQNELDYFTINDHQTFAAAQDDSVVNEKNIIIIVGAEINDPDNNNHYLVFNTDKVIIGEKPESYLKAYREAGAIGFAAHPFERRASSKFRKYIWTDRGNDGFDGIEIWNYVSEWLGKLNPNWNGLFMVLFPSLFVVKPFREIITYWDKLNLQGKRKAGIGSVDGHGEKYRILGIQFTFLKHRTLFKSIRTNVLIPEGNEINDQSILSALKNGNSYIANYRLGRPYNFYAGMGDGQNSIISGEEINFTENLKLYFRLPVYARVKLIRNGQKISSRWHDKGFFPITDKGNYRLEINRFGRAWIYTNNFYVT